MMHLPMPCESLLKNFGEVGQGGPTCQLRGSTSTYPRSELLCPIIKRFQRSLRAESIFLPASPDAGPSRHQQLGETALYLMITPGSRGKVTPGRKRSNSSAVFVVSRSIWPVRPQRALRARASPNHVPPAGVGLVGLGAAKTSKAHGVDCLPQALRIGLGLSDQIGLDFNGDPRRSHLLQPLRCFFKSFRRHFVRLS